MTHWILRERRPGGYYLLFGRLGDSVWGPQRNEAKQYRSRSTAKRRAERESLQGCPVRMVKVTEKCTCGRCPVHGPAPKRSTER